jgi:hypothetical protein
MKAVPLYFSEIRDCIPELRATKERRKHMRRRTKSFTCADRQLLSKLIRSEREDALAKLYDFVFGSDEWGKKED